MTTGSIRTQRYEAASELIIDQGLIFNPRFEASTL